MNTTYMDAPQAWQWGFQDAATPVMQGIIDVHHDIFMFLLFILVFVSWVLGRTLWHFNSNANATVIPFTHGTVIEIVWTVLPSVILMTIAFPSFALLYSMNEIIDPALTVKAIGSQWYWTYEYSDNVSDEDASIRFESYLKPDLELGEPRLLEVDNRVVVPVNTNIRVLVTSTDVLHSWAVPSLGVKCDAIPGRLNQALIYILREGVFYGQCSELCGAYHGFMPIVVESVSASDYIEWATERLSE